MRAICGATRAPGAFQEAFHAAPAIRELRVEMDRLAAAATVKRPVDDAGAYGTDHDDADAFLRRSVPADDAVGTDEQPLIDERSAHDAVRIAHLTFVPAKAGRLFPTDTTGTCRPRCG